MQPKVTWIYNQTTELSRVMYTLGNLSRGFYENNNFTILPYPSNFISPSVVLLPKANFGKIDALWQKAQKYDFESIMVLKNNSLENEISKLLEQKNYFSMPNFAQQKTNFAQIQEEVIAELNKSIFVKKPIKTLEIYPTKFGTITSTNCAEDGHIQLFLREDATNGDIILSIITSYTRTKLETYYKASWKEAQIVTDYFLKEFSLNKFLPKNYVTALDSTKNTYLPAGIINKQEELLRQIGYKTSKTTLEIKNDQICFGNKEIRGLTYFEQYTLAEMIQKKGTIISPEELFDLVCVNSPKFSLYAVNKAIQRLRDKFKSNNIPTTAIRTVRGQGYMIN